MLQQKGTTSKMVLVVLFAVYALLSTGGLVLFKLGGQDAALQLGRTGFSLTLSWKMLLGIFCYLCSFLLWLVIVSRTQLTFAMPLSVGVVNTLVFLGLRPVFGGGDYPHENRRPCGDCPGAVSHQYPEKVGSMEKGGFLP